MTFSAFNVRDIEVPSITENIATSNGLQMWGDDNRFPQTIWDFYLRSSQVQSIIDGTCDFVGGNGIDVREDLREFASKKNKMHDNLEGVISKLVFDYQLLGGFALKVMRNFNGDVCELRWMDARFCRVDAEQKILRYYPKGMEKRVYEDYPIYDEEQKYATSVLWFKNSKSRGVYPIPRYVGALTSIAASTEIADFHLNGILNSFSASAIINFNNADSLSQEDKDAIVKKLKQNYSGARNAAKTLVSFNQGKDQQVTIARVPEDGFDQKYTAMKEFIRADIYTAFRAIPQLFGSTETSGFNSNEFEEAFRLYQRTVVAPCQHTIEEVFDQLFGEGSIRFVEWSMGEHQREDNQEQEQAEEVAE